MALDLDQMEKDALQRLEWALNDACYAAKAQVKAGFSALRLTFPLKPPPVVKRIRKPGPGPGPYRETGAKKK